ncbi:MAG: hypothetical protein MH132_05550 [Hydrotalea sp.]|nr:hypothetical protein [Hydrotalea sp.]
MKVIGKVIDMKNLPIGGAIIKIHTKNDSKLAGYGFTNDSGRFTITFSEIKTKYFFAEINALNYGTEIFEFILENNTIYLPNIILQTRPSLLNEVVVKNSSTISNKKDTINYNVDAFSSKYDKAIGDVIKRLPGVEILSDGTIKYEGKPINKFYINGKDLLDGRYNIATSNIPYDAVDKVQILEKHQPSKMLDSFIHSNKAALNLVLKREINNKLLGKLKLGIGTPFFSTDNELVPLYFSKNNQTINTLKYNNIGKDYAAEFKNLYLNQDADELFSVENFGQLTGIDKPINGNLNLDRFLYNKQLTASINHLRTTKNGNEIKVLIDYTNDNEQIQNNSTFNVFFNNNNFSIQESIHFNQKRNLLNGITSFERNYKNAELSNKLQFRLAFKNATAVITTPNKIEQYSNIESFTIANTFKFTFKKRRLLQNITFYISTNRNPQNLNVLNANYDFFFSDSIEPSKILQLANLSITKSNLTYTSSYKINKSLSFSNSLNYKFLYNNINTEVKGFMNGNPIDIKNGFANNISLINHDISNVVSLSYSKKRSTYSLSIPINYINLYSIQNTNNRQIINNIYSGINLIQDVKLNNKIKLNNTLINQFYLFPPHNATNNFVLRNYRLITNNESLPNSLTTTILESVLNFKNLKYLSYNTLGIRKEWNTNFPIMNNSFINQLVVLNGLSGNQNQQSEKIFISTNKYFTKIKSSITAQTFLEFIRSDNFSNSILTRFRNTNFNLTLSSNTNLKKITIENRFSYTLFDNKTKGTTLGYFSLIEYLFNLKTSLKENISLQMNSQFNSLRRNNQNSFNLFFSDFFLTFSIPKIKTDFEFGCQNIFNQKIFSDVTISRNSQTLTETNLRPRQALIKLSWYFK